nr:MAG TPA: hypothetical protein [Caudoviricetes sp.]
MERLPRALLKNVMRMISFIFSIWKRIILLFLLKN